MALSAIRACLRRRRRRGRRRGRRRNIGWIWYTND
jgi:hypothetical protein